MTSKEDKIQFIIGPAYSGKSEQLLEFIDTKIRTLFIGTSDSLDPLQKNRVLDLKKLRPLHWQQMDISTDLNETLDKTFIFDFEQIIIDSISQWQANLIMSSIGKYDSTQLQNIVNLEAETLLKNFNLIYKSKTKLTVISSECGASLPPAREAERLYRSSVGIINQKIAKLSDSVISIQAGVPNKIK